MKKYLIVLFLLTAAFQAMGQGEGDQASTLKKVIVLKPSDYGTGNGASVVWNPDLKLYYAARAGSAGFPLDIFDANGKKISGEYKTLFDIRGMWYDRSARRICMNGFGSSGWAYYKLDNKGRPVSVVSVVDSLNQPEENSVGCFSDSRSRVYFLDSMKIIAYNAKDGTRLGDQEGVDLSATINVNYTGYLDENFDDLPGFYNPALVYTGIQKQEFGLLNFETNQIDLFDASTGELTQSLTLPEGSGPEDHFNFAYTNGMFFLYNKADKVWTGYK
jgi:hypothetical protein